MMETNLTLFENHQIRKFWQDDQWWFAVVDLVAALNQAPEPSAEWRKIKRRLKRQGADITAIRPFAFTDESGRQSQVDCANMQLLLRIIQAIPSPNADQFKLRLAQLGSERLDEAWDPEVAYAELHKRHREYQHGGMTRREMALSTFVNNLASALHDERGSEGYAEIHRDVVDAGHLRQQVEAITGKPVVSSRNMAIKKDGGLWDQIDESASL